MSVRPAERGGELSVLFLCDDSPSHAPNVLEHIGAFRRWSLHRLEVFNPVGVARSRLLRFAKYDIVVVHYTISVLHDSHLSPWFRDELTGFDGLKVQFIQDEYRSVNAVTERIRELGINLLFSSIPVDVVPRIYGARLPGVDVVPTLTGYVPAELEDLARPPLTGRALDVVYRGRSVPYWLGRLGQDKAVIGQEFLARAASTGLRCDISWTEAERVYGDAWYSFLSSSRATLGTESGASIVDFDGSLQRKTERYIRANPAATFEEVEREILAPSEGNVVIEAVSPRVFEAAALGTAMINFPGRYSDVIEPEVHYVPLEKDFSNFEDVVAAIHDDRVLDAIAARAHEDLVLSGRYSLRTLVRKFEQEIDERVSPAQRRPRPRFARKLEGKLLELEQLRSPERRAELPLVVSLRSRAIERTSRRLIDRFPGTAALRDWVERDTPHERSSRVTHDLVRLAAAEAAHVRELRYLGQPFDVQPKLSLDGRRLTLVSTRRPPQDSFELDRLRSRVASAIRGGRLEEIVWDNSGVGTALTFPTIPIASLQVGFHLIGGAHRFTALLEVADRNPNGVIAALEPLFRSRPVEPVHELDLMLRSLLNLRATAAPGAAAIRAALGPKHPRRLLRAYLRSPGARAEAPIDLLLKDFLTLRLVAESRASPELDSECKRLVYRTDPGLTRNGLALDAATVGALEQIVWDHSAVGSSVTSKTHPAVSLMLEGGVHEFHALTPLARRFPELALPALQWAAGAE